MVNVIRGSSAKPVSSQRLAKYFEERTDIEGTLVSKGLLFLILMREKIMIWILKALKTRA